MYQVAMHLICADPWATCSQRHYQTLHGHTTKNMPRPVGHPMAKSNDTLAT